MKSTFRTLFYLRKDRVNADGLVPIMVHITINSQMTQFSSKLEVNPNLWDTKQGRAIGRAADATNLNQLLDNLRAKIDSLYNKKLGDKGYALPDTIKNKLQGNDTDRKSLVDYFNLLKSLESNLESAFTNRPSMGILAISKVLNNSPRESSILYKS